MTTITISLTPEETNAYLEALTAASSALYHSVYAAGLLDNLHNVLWDALLEQYIKAEDPKMYLKIHRIRGL